MKNYISHFLFGLFIPILFVMVIHEISYASPVGTWNRTIGLISVSSNEALGNFGSYEPSISLDGRFVAFSSNSNNLVSDDNNNSSDIFVRDRYLGETYRSSISSQGIEGNGTSGDPSISADGRFVAFSSAAMNLVGNDLNNKSDIFVYDLTTKTTTRVSVASDGSEANGTSYYPSISDDGRYVAFASEANNLVTNDTNTCHGSDIGRCGDVFVHDRFTKQTMRVSVSSDGEQSNDKSPNYGLENFWQWKICLV